MATNESYQPSIGSEEEAEIDQVTEADPLLFEEAEHQDQPDENEEKNTNEDEDNSEKENKEDGENSEKENKEDGENSEKEADEELEFSMQVCGSPVWTGYDQKWNWLTYASDAREDEEKAAGIEEPESPWLSDSESEAENEPLAEDMTEEKRLEIAEDLKRERTNEHDNYKSQRCFCGCSLYLHPGVSEMWCHDYDTSYSLGGSVETSPTDSYGTFSMKSGEFVRAARYLRTSFRDSETYILDYVDKNWFNWTEANQKPDMCIAFAGSPDSFQYSKGKMRNLKKFIKRVGGSANLLIITDGLNAGWAQTVNSIVEDIRALGTNNRIEMLGLVPYSQLFQSWRFQNKHNTPENPLTVNPFEDKCGYSQYSLNPECLHFIFWDDGTRYGVRFEGPSCQTAIFLSELVEERGIPCVAISSGNDYLDVVNVGYLGRSNIPTVVLKNNQRTTDLIFEYYICGKEERYSYSELFKEDIPAMIADHKYTLNAETPYLLRTAARGCAEIFSNYIDLHFVEITNESELSETAGLFAGSSANLAGTLRLMMKLNNPESFRQTLIRKAAYSTENLEPILTDALKYGAFTFVKDLMDLKLDLNKYLTIQRLQELYVATACDASELTFNRILNLYDIKCDRGSLTLWHINQLMRKIMGKFNCTFYEETAAQNEEWLAKRRFHGPSQEVFLWAVLRQNRELAKLFWNISPDRVFLAVTATCICRRIATALPPSEDNVIKSIISFSNYFEGLAIEMLAKCTMICPDFKWTAYSLTKETWNCGQLSVVATIGDCRRFLGTIEMQDFVFSSWTNNLDTRATYLIAAILFPPLIASDAFVRWDKRVTKTEEEVRLEAIDQSLITRKVGQDSFEVRAEATYCEKFRRIYQSVQAKYFLRFLLYIPVLLFATYTIFFDMVPSYYSISELILLVLLISQFLDVTTSMVECAKYYGSSTKGMLGYFHFFWFELSIMINFTLCAILRLTLPESLFVYTKSAAATLLMQMYLRLFVFLRINRTLGPFLTILTRMLGVTVVFAVILLVVLLPSGITQQALLFPNRTDISATLKDIFFFDYYRLYGELSLEISRAEKDGCNATSIDPDCPHPNMLVPIIVAGYMLVANVFMINVLIAVFSNVITEEQEKAMESWKYNFLIEITQYRYRWLAPPPFNLLEIFVRIFDAIWFQARNESLFMPPDPRRLKAKQDAEKNSKTSDWIDEDDVDYGEVATGLDADGEVDDSTLEWAQDEAGEAKQHAYQAVQHLALAAMDDDILIASVQSQLAKGQKMAADVTNVVSVAQEIMFKLRPDIFKKDNEKDKKDEGEDGKAKGPEEDEKKEPIKKETEVEGAFGDSEDDPDPSKLVERMKNLTSQMNSFFKEILVVADENRTLRTD